MNGIVPKVLSVIFYEYRMCSDLHTGSIQNNYQFDIFGFGSQKADFVMRVLCVLLVQCTTVMTNTVFALLCHISWAMRLQWKKPQPFHNQSNSLEIRILKPKPPPASLMTGPTVKTLLQTPSICHWVQSYKH